MYMQGNILRSAGVLQCHTGPQKSYSKTWDVLVDDASKHCLNIPPMQQVIGPKVGFTKKPAKNKCKYLGCAYQDSVGLETNEHPITFQQSDQAST